MSILSDDDLTTVAGAMLGVLKKGGPDIVAYAESEASKFAASIETITSLYASSQISKDEATAQLQLQKNASQAVLTAVEGITLILATQAINAGLAAVAAIVNKAIGFVLL
jgi:hypothetical protein